VIYQLNDTKFSKHSLPNDLSEYFSLGYCLDGLRIISDKLFDISLRIAEVTLDEVYGEETVFKVEVIDPTDNNKLLGIVYMDLFERRNRVKNDCTFPIRQSSMHSDISVVCICMNFSPAKKGLCLLGLNQLETFFHEFGHAMHSVLSKSRYQHLSGTRVYMDFMETPSQLFEFFIYSYPVLSQFARHYKTGKTIPRDYLTSMLTWRDSFAAVLKQYEIYKAILDMVFHSDLHNITSPSISGENNGNPIADSKMIQVAAQLQRKYTVYEHATGTCDFAKLDHLISYGASYYSYLYSGLYASTIWHTCLHHDPLSREQGLKLKRELFERGGTRSPEEILQALCGSVKLGSYIGHE
jgi:intermediate peptidase